MALTLENYAGLVETIREYTARPDCPAEIFVQQAHSDLRGVRHRLMERTIRLSAAEGSEGATLPVDFLELKTCKLNGRSLTLTSVHNQVDADGDPTGFTVSGNVLQLSPRPRESVKLLVTYYGKIPKLSPDTPSNWLLDEYPEIYLHAALTHAYEWLRDPEGEAASHTRLADAIALMNRENSRSRFKGALPGGAI